MSIQPGDKIPSVTIKEATADGPKDVDVAALLAGKKAIIFSLPGAFTPTCSQKHLPGFVAKYDELIGKGVDIIACLSVNDAHVMRAWAEQHNALGKIVMLADGNAAFTRAIGLELDLTGAQMGLRGRRAAIEVVDGVVKRVDVESPGKFEVSGADACLARL
jgi:glutaredoxin/glutathione-dependent peroxiredoxin